MSPALVAVVTGLVSGLGGAAVGGFVTLRKVRSDLAAGYDRDLLVERLERYRSLWPEFAPLSITKAAPLTPAELQAVSDRLRAWYFEGGGLFLSGTSMDYYNLLQREIGQTLAGATEITEKQLALVRFLAASLRTRLTQDVGSRRRGMLFGASRPYELRKRRRLYRRALAAADKGGYAGPELDRSARGSADAEIGAVVEVDDGLR